MARLPRSARLPARGGLAPHLPSPAKASGQPAAPAAPQPGGCACGGGCPRCAARGATAGGQPLDGWARQQLAPHFGRSLAQVRLHTDAAAAAGAQALDAPALAQHQHIAWGRSAPPLHSSAGMALLAHEVAHTLQAAGETAAPRWPQAPATRSEAHAAALERNADALVRRPRTPLLRAGAGQWLAGPFDAETAEQRSRRQRLLHSIDNAAAHLRELLRSGGLLLGDEALVERGGVAGVAYGLNTVGTPREVFSSLSDRDARMRRILRTLMDMGRHYRGAPLPDAFTPPVAESAAEGGGFSSWVPPESADSGIGFHAPDAEETDLQAAFERYRRTLGQTGAEFELDWYYIDARMRIAPGAARGAPRLGGGIATGVFMVVPDMENEPLRMYRLYGHTAVPRGAQVVELWHDSFGYYYMNEGRRVDVRSPWARDDEDR